MTRRLRIAAGAAVVTALAVMGVPAGGLHALRAAALPAPFCRVYLDPHNKFTRVVPPRAEGASLTTNAALSTITVEYSSGFTAPAQVAFQAAVDLWSTQVSSSIPIVIKADFLDLGGGGLLGQAGPTCAFANFQGATRADTWFATAIANRLHGSDMTPAGTCAAEEISAQFNNQASWYFGTDGFTPSNQVDFMSVVLHELGHGLGFIGVGTVSSGLGTVGQGYPYIYDANVSDGAGISVLDTNTYPNGSAALGTLLTSNALYWNGANGIAANNGSRPKLYAPSVFQSGSSYSHLDETQYPAGNANSLMTPAIAYAEAIHTPGPIMLGMFNDMGWGSQCSYGLDQSTASVPAAGGTVNVAVSTGAGCAWSSSTTATFVSGTTSGVGTGTLTLTVAANTSTTGRTATVTIADQTLTIAQAGSTPCTYALGASGTSVGATASTGTVGLATSTGCSWTAASSNAAVATITTALTGQGSATVGYSVSGNTGPSARSATLTIGGQSFAIAQGACTYALGSSSAAIASAGGTINVAVSTSASCAWTASTASTFVALGSAGGTGNATVQLTVRPNTSTESRSAAATIAGQTFTVTQNGTSPTLVIDKTSLVFGAVSNGASFTTNTSTQLIRLSQSGAGTVTWTAASSQPWLTVSPSSGTGSAVLGIGVQFASALASTQTGTITLTLTGAGNTVGPIAVRLNVMQSGASAAPVGSFDTPVDGTTGIAGSIGVTGWAMDDVEVSSITICRDAVTGEAALANPHCNGQTKIFVGNGVFIDGARPDVQGSFPSLPRNTRAGWGYLMLTNFLPNLGNGTYKLYAYANDADGHSTLLGSKTIACANSASTAPFGAIDTPGQGDIVAAVVGNFGWVLSPGSAKADPPDGGTVSVLVDGVNVGAPSGWTARGDLSAVFPAAAYSGVARALGVYGLDTTALTNGVHTIQWVVTDTSGRGAGVGSRFFSVSNGNVTAVNAQVLNSQLLNSEGRTVRARRGYDPDAPFQTYSPDAGGTVTIQAEELDRIEIALAPGTNGALLTPSGITPLPVGSHLDPASGTFTWQAGVGFVGAYDLVFVSSRDGGAPARQDVRVVLNPKGSNRVGLQTIIDAPVVGHVFRRAATPDPIVVTGWAADLDSASDSGVAAVHVWAYPVNSRGEYEAPVFLGAATYGGARPDVGAIYGERFTNSGYGLIVSDLAPGTYDIAVFAYSTVRGRFADAKVVRITIAD